MGARVFWLSLFRFLCLLFSLATLACHIAQIVMLNAYMKDNDVDSWFPGYVPYILYFVGPGVSMICAIALNIVSISSIKSVRGDRSMCVINVALMAACVVYNTLKQGVIPWSGGKASGGPKSANLGFASYCNLYNDKTTQLRCWLTDGVWLGCIVVAAFWLILAIYVYVQSSSDIYDNDFDVYDYKDDVPMAVTMPPMQTKTDTAQEYHASSPVHNGNVDYGYYNQPAGGYPEYDSYYDYPPQSAYAGYKQPVAAGHYGYTGNGAYMVSGRPDDTVHMLSDVSTDPNHQAYYSPHLATTQAPATPTTTTAHTTAQSPNAY